MQIQLISALSMAAAATALRLPVRAPCASPATVEFHYNDTTIGTTTSCTTDVTNRGSSSESTAERLRLRLRDDDDYYCTDGGFANYTVVSGDTLEKIAADYNSGVCNIAAANDLANPDFILIDQVLIIPTDVCEPDNDSCRTAAGDATCLINDGTVSSTYTIEGGDTFFLIAAELGITLDSLLAANEDVDPATLQIGQVINVPLCDESK